MRDDPKPCVFSKLVSVAVAATAVLAIWGQTGKPDKPHGPPLTTAQAVVDQFAAR